MTKSTEFLFRAKKATSNIEVAFCIKLDIKTEDHLRRVEASV